MCSSTATTWSGAGPTDGGGTSPRRPGGSSAQLQDLAARRGDDLTVVFDGRPLPDLAEGDHDGVRVAYARRPGRDAGDDRIVEEVGNDDDPASLTVVTSDRELARRARELGAHVSKERGSLTRELGSERP